MKASTLDEWKKSALAALHEIEDEYNKELIRIDKQIGSLAGRKKVLGRLISKNMKHRNRIINLKPQQ